MLLTTCLIFFFFLILFVSPLQPIQSTRTTKKTVRKSIFHTETVYTRKSTKFQFLIILDYVQTVTKGLQQYKLINQISLGKFFKKKKRRNNPVLDYMCGS